jgi:hypothetical protein
MMTTGPSGHNEEEYRTWYIAFTDDRRVELWWTKFLKRDFGHCMAFAQTGAFVTVIEPLWHTVQIETYFNQDDPKAGLSAELVALSWVDMGYKVVEVKTKVDFSLSIRHIWNIIPTCVTLIKTLTGLRGWGFTPYQLYKLALARGGIEITETERKERLMSVFKPKKPDTSAQEASLKKQEDEAKAAAAAEAKETNDSLTARRRKQRGRFSLIANEGGELGVGTNLGK